MSVISSSVTLGLPHSQWKDRANVCVSGGRHMDRHTPISEDNIDPSKIIKKGPTTVTVLARGVQSSRFWLGQKVYVDSTNVIEP